MLNTIRIARKTYLINSNIMFFFLFLFLFSGCTNHTEPIFYIDDTESIRYEVRNKINSVAWNYSQENYPEQKNYYFPYPGISSTRDGYVYPTYKNFYPIDISSLSSADVQFINDFISLLTGKKVTRDCFSEDKNYLSIICNYEFENLPETDKWIIGEPAINGNLYSVPVRIFFSEKYMDICLHIKKENALLIENITFGDLTDAR